MAGNTALAFGALVAGGVVIEYGVKNFRNAGGSSSTGASTPSADPTGSTGNTTLTGSVAQAQQRAIALEGTPYVWGGGHVSNAFAETLAQIKSGGLDCSGYVSQILGPEGLGVLSAPEDTEGLAQSLSPGAGKQVTVYINPAEHTIINIGGIWYAAQSQGTFASRITAQEAQATISSIDMTAYHPQGY